MELVISLIWTKLDIDLGTFETRERGVSIRAPKVALSFIKIKSAWTFAQDIEPRTVELDMSTVCYTLERSYFSSTLLKSAKFTQFDDAWFEITCRNRLHLR